MAFLFEKEKTGSTPYILIDEEKGYMKFAGESFHENVLEFYNEVDSWLDVFLKTNFGTFIFDCELEYFSSSTAKYLLSILMKIDEHASGQKKITVNWITTGDNDIIIESGEDFREEIGNIDFNLVIK